MTLSGVSVFSFPPHNDHSVDVVLVCFCFLAFTHYSNNKCWLGTHTLVLLCFFTPSYSDHRVGMVILCWFFYDLLMCYSHKCWSSTCMPVLSSTLLSQWMLVWCLCVSGDELPVYWCPCLLIMHPVTVSLGTTITCMLVVRCCLCIGVPVSCLCILHSRSWYKQYLYVSGEVLPVYWCPCLLIMHPVTVSLDTNITCTLVVRCYKCTGVPAYWSCILSQ